MYAVFEDGSHQYRVSEGEKVRIDYRADAEPGTQVEFGRILLYQNGDDTRIGQPTVEGMRVIAEVLKHPSEKLYVQHFRRRKNYRRLRGHRQHYTLLRIRNILLPGTEPPAPDSPPAPPSEASAPAPSQPTA
jgi:large subunit ribosomal protein L21